MTKKTVAVFGAALIVLIAAFWYINRNPAFLAPPPPPPSEQPTPLPPLTPQLAAKNWDAIIKQAAGPPLGNPNAPWTIIECGDFQCPNCHIARPRVENLIRNSGGKIKLYFFNRVITLHPYAFGAAEAGLAASAQGKFWPMYDMLYTHQDELSPSQIIYNTMTMIHGINANQLDSDLTSHKYGPRVMADEKLANATGLNATPTFLVRASSGGPVTIYCGTKKVHNSDRPALYDLMKAAPWNVPAPVAAQPAPKAAPAKS